MKFRISILSAVLVLQGLISAAFGAVQIVDANNPLPGDSFTVAGSSNSGQAVGSTSWYYNNVRNNGTVGINTTYARSGNGSMYLEGTVGPGGSSSKGDAEFLLGATPNGNGNFAPSAPLGLLKDLTSLSYDWYRDSSSTNAVFLHPVLRLMLVSDDLTKAGYIVFERAYNQGLGAVPTDSWVTDDVLGSNSNMWSTGTLPDAFTKYDRTLGEWKSSFGNYSVVGVSAGFGSGWGPFTGAVDNITFGFSGNDTTYNFEVGAVPEPMSFVVWGAMVLCGAAFARKITKKGLSA